MFNYGDLTWTTGTYSGGNPVTGRGGTRAGVSIAFHNGGSIIKAI